MSRKLVRAAVRFQYTNESETETDARKLGNALMSACDKQIPQGPSVGGSNHHSDNDRLYKALSGPSNNPPTKEGRVSKKKASRRGNLSVMQKRMLGRSY